VEELVHGTQDLADEEYEINAETDFGSGTAGL
jgi:hypothetical protein